MEGVSFYLLDINGEEITVWLHHGPTKFQLKILESYHHKNSSDSDSAVIHNSKQT